MRTVRVLAAGFVLALAGNIGAWAGEGAETSSPARSGYADGVPLIDFENWVAQPRQDITIVGPAARVVNRMGEAHSGEGYLVMEGDHTMQQRSVTLENIHIKPNMTYELSFYYRSTEELRSNRTVLLEYFQTDREGALISVGNEIPAIAPLPVDRWTLFKRQVVTQPNARRMTIRWRFDYILPGSKLFLDDIALTPAASNVFFDWEIDPDTATLTGNVTPSGDMANDVSQVTAIVLRDGQVFKTQKLKAGEGHFSMDLHGFTDGVPYYITAVAQRKDGRLVFSENEDLNDVKAGRQTVSTQFEGIPVAIKLTDKYNLFYTYVDPKNRSWEGNNIGMLGPQEPPPRPWPALTCDAKACTVTSWNNTFIPGPGLSTLAILFHNPRRELTTEPVRLSLNGEPLATVFRFTPTHAASVSPHTVVLTSSGEGRNMRLEMSMTIDFAGLVRTRMKFLPLQGSSPVIDKLTLDLRFTPGFARQSFFACDRVAEQPFVTKRFYPYFWTGNDDTGLLWCADRMYPSRRTQETDWLRFEAPEDKGTLAINMVNKSTPIPADGLTVEFGLMPSPARPFNAALRNVRVRIGPDSTLEMIAGSLDTAFKYYGWPELTSRAAFDDFLVRDIPRHHTGTRAALTFYLAGGCAMETIPQMTYFKKLWINRAGVSYKSGTPGYDVYATGDTTDTDLGQTSWTDLVLWKLQQLLEQNPEIKGTYNDTNFPSIEGDDGQVHCPVFAGYEYHKRIAVLLDRLRGDEAVTIYHHDMDTLLPYTAFADYLLVGEMVAMPLLEHNYYNEFLTLPEFRAVFRAPIGGLPMLLPQYLQPAKATDPKLTAHLTGISLVHGIMPWAASTPQRDQMVRQQLDFGDLSHAAWFPYWEPNPYVRSGNEAVLASFYERQGDLFIILFNNSKEPQKTRLKLSDAYAKRYPAPGPARLYDPLTANVTDCTLTGDGAEIEIEPYQSRLITVTNSVHQ